MSWHYVSRDKKLSSYNAWLVHLRSSHKYFSCLADYKTSHGDPSVVKFKHNCRLCGLELFLNLTIVKRHLSVQHSTSVSQYLSQFREELLEEVVRLKNVVHELQVKEVDIILRWTSFL